MKYKNKRLLAWMLRFARNSILFFVTITSCFSWWGLTFYSARSLMFESDSNPLIAFGTLIFFACFMPFILLGSVSVAIDHKIGDIRIVRDKNVKNWEIKLLDKFTFGKTRAKIIWIIFLPLVVFLWTFAVGRSMVAYIVKSITSSKLFKFFKSSKRMFTI